MTEIADRVLRRRRAGLAVRAPVTGRAAGHPGARQPVPARRSGWRWAWGGCRRRQRSLREVGKLLAYLKEPEPPKGFEGRLGQAAGAEAGAQHGAKEVSLRALPAGGVEGDEVDLAKLPIQHCWPGDAAPLITWGLVVTRGPHKKRQNLGIYRQQVIGRNR